MQGEIAIFVAGDENIFFPALVALDSIQKNNPGLFTAFICFDAKKLTADMEEALNYHSINFIDSEHLAVSDRIKSTEKMKEARWPVEILLNWAMPEYLLSLGFARSIKVDYDILCIHPYDLDSVMPKKAIARGLSFDADPVAHGMVASAVEEAIRDGIFRPGIKSYVNAGFVSFNNEACAETRFFDRLMNAYAFITKRSPDAGLIEQIALQFVFSTTEGGIDELDSSYNARVRWGLLVRDDLTLTAKNIHYITGFKPWKALQKQHVKQFVNDKQGVLFAYRAIWLNYASNSPWFSKFCSQKDMTIEQQLGLMIITCHYYNHKIFDLESKLKSVHDLSKI